MPARGIENGSRRHFPIPEPIRLPPLPVHETVHGTVRM